MTDTPLVAIHNTVYNHEPYLRECLDGFVMQKTDFRFVVITHDDCSTDGSAAIIREYAEKYPDIFRPIYETENQYSKRDGSLTRIMNEAIAATGAKYVAMCEGDDYWTDPYKLQKQVDYMEGHPECVLCYTDNDIMSINGNVVYVEKKPAKTFKELFLCNTIATLTTLTKADIFIDAYNLNNDSILLKKIPMTDYPLWLRLSLNGKIGYIQDITSTYRLLRESASHSTNKHKMYIFNCGVVKCKSFFLEEYKKYCQEDLSFCIAANEQIFHLRKHLLLTYGLMAREQIIPLVKLLPYWPIVFYRSIKRKLRNLNR